MQKERKALGGVVQIGAKKKDSARSVHGFFVGARLPCETC